MRATLNARSPRCPMVRMAEMLLEVSQEEALADAAIDCAQRHVGSFLSLAQLLAGLTEELPLANTVWELAEEAQMEPVANVGTMAFRRTDGSIGRLDVTAREQRALGGGLMLTMRYDGTRSKTDRESELYAIRTRLASALSTDHYGGIVLGNSALFLDGNIVGLNIPVGDLHVQQGVWTGTPPASHSDPDPAPRSNPAAGTGETPVT